MTKTEPELWEGMPGDPVIDPAIAEWLEEHVEEFTDESAAQVAAMTAPAEPAEEQEPPAEEPAEEPEQRPVRMPTAGDMLQLDNGLYLPVRKRVQWLRQTPGPNPGWTIRTTLHEASFAPGTPHGTTRRGGFALVFAEVIDENGRLIATGHGSEWSERFENFIEAAETAAVGRALALAGYGTDAALEEAHIVDSPTRPTPPPAPANGGPIVVNVEPASLGEVAVGGRSKAVTGAQLDAIRKIAREKEIGVRAMARILRSLGIEVAASREAIAKCLDGLTFAQAASVIKALEDE